MEWIEQVQRDLGAPVVQFALEHWLLLIVAVALGAWWLVGGSFGRGPAEGGIVIGGDITSSADDGDGGGGDGGGD